jgi:hypothetical protein
MLPSGKNDKSSLEFLKVYVCVFFPQLDNMGAKEREANNETGKINFFHTTSIFQSIVFFFFF